MNRLPRFKVLGRLGILSCALSVPAQATQPLESFLERAETQSFDAREASITQRQRAAEADVALARLIPAFTARGVYTRNQREVAVPLDAGPDLVITPQNQLDALLQLDVPIVDLASYHRYKSAQALERSASAQRDATTIDVSRGVARAYYQFLGASALARSAQESIGLAQANQKNVDARRAAGAATELDNERALANVARAEQDLADAALGVALSARSLESLSGLSPEPAATTFAADDLRLEGSLESWLSRARETPLVRAGNHLREAAEENRKAASRAILPTLSGSAQERLTNATGFGGEASSYSLQLILAWRLDYSVGSLESAQQAALDAQAVRVERTERAALDATFEAYQRVQAGIAKSRAARAQARAATRAAELSQDRYAAGAATQLDVTQAQRDAFLAAASQIQADSDLAYARAALRLAVGAPVSTTSAPSAER